MDWNNYLYSIYKVLSLSNLERIQSVKRYIDYIIVLCAIWCSFLKTSIKTSVVVASLQYIYIYIYCISTVYAAPFCPFPHPNLFLFLFLMTTVLTRWDGISIYLWFAFLRFLKRQTTFLHFLNILYFVIECYLFISVEHLLTGVFDFLCLAFSVLYIF